MARCTSELMLPEMFPAMEISSLPGEIFMASQQPVRTSNSRRLQKCATYTDSAIRTGYHWITNIKVNNSTQFLPLFSLEYIVIMRVYEYNMVHVNSRYTYDSECTNVGIVQAPRYIPADIEEQSQK